MNRTIALSTKAAVSLLLVLPFAACGGATDDASIGSNKNALGAGLKEGDACPAEKCGNSPPGCTSPANSPPLKQTNIRCVALPQVGSAVGLCRWAYDCLPETSTLKEGDTCPAEKCADSTFACANPNGTPATSRNVKCVAGPQVGSGVGVCQLVGECASAP